MKGRGGEMKAKDLDSLLRSQLGSRLENSVEFLIAMEDEPYDCQSSHHDETDY